MAPPPVTSDFKDVDIECKPSCTSFYNTQQLTTFRHIAVIPASGVINETPRSGPFVVDVSTIVVSGEKLTVPVAVITMPWLAHKTVHTLVDRTPVLVAFVEEAIVICGRKNTIVCDI